MGSCIENSYKTEHLNHALSCVTCWSWWNETQSIQSNEKKDESISESLDCSPAPLSLSNRCSTGGEFDFDIHVHYKAQKVTGTKITRSHCAGRDNSLHRFGDGAADGDTDGDTDGGTDCDTDCGTDCGSYVHIMGKYSNDTVETILSSSSKEYSSSEDAREEIEVDCNSSAESRDGISECNSHSSINTNQVLSTVTLGVYDSTPTPCQHPCVNNKVLNQNHDSGKTFCDSSTNESRTSLVSCDSSTARESRTSSVVTDDKKIQHRYCLKHEKDSVGAHSISTLRFLVLRRRAEAYKQSVAKEERLGDNMLKSPIQSERLQKILVTNTYQTIRYPLTRKSPRPSVRSTVLPPKRVKNLLTSRAHRLNEKYKQTQDDLVSLTRPSSTLSRSSHKGRTRRRKGKKHIENQ